MRPVPVGASAVLDVVVTPETTVRFEHLAPSGVGDAVRVTARCVALRGNRVTCECTPSTAGGGSSAGAPPCTAS